MLVLGNEQFIRPMAFGSNWNRIRICLRYCIYGTGTFIGGLGVGVCKSGTQYHGSNSDMVYYCCNAAADPATTFLIYRSTLDRYSFAGTTSGYHFCSAKVGNTVYNTTPGGSNAGQAVFNGIGAYPLRFLMAVDIIRGTSTFTMDSYFKENTSSAPSLTDQTQASFFNDLENPTPAQITTQFTPAGATGYTGGSGLLDCVWIRWMNTSPVLLISDVGVCRYS